jgi:DHA1 family bicyclomycin/chloramphenicol resistance-like MFS transporter
VRSWLAAPPVRGTAKPPLWLLFALCISGTLSLHILVPALPEAAADLGVSGGAIQLALTLYLVGLAGGQLFYGPLSDRLGRRPVLLGGLCLYVLGSLGCALAPGIGALIGGRVVQALGGCSGLVLGRAILRDVSPPRARPPRSLPCSTFSCPSRRPPRRWSAACSPPSWAGARSSSC